MFCNNDSAADKVSSFLSFISITTIIFLDAFTPVSMELLHFELPLWVRKQKAALFYGKVKNKIERLQNMNEHFCNIFIFFLA